MDNISSYFSERGIRMTFLAELFLEIADELAKYGLEGFDEDFEYGQGLESGFEGNDKYSIISALKGFERGIMVGQHTGYDICIAKN